jgi:hypothetical protein
MCTRFFFSANSSTSSAPETLGAAGVRDRGLLISRPPPPPTGYTWCSLLVLGCSSPPLSPPSSGLARGAAGGVRIGGLRLLFSATLTAVPGPGPGSAAGGANWWTWTALLRHSRRRLRAWPGGGGGGADCWIWAALLRHSHRHSRAWRGAWPARPGGGGGRADCWTWAALLLRHSRHRLRAWPGGGGGGCGLKILIYKIKILL